MIYTDALQTLIMVVGAVILTVKGEGWGCSGGRGGLEVTPGGSQPPAGLPWVMDGGCLLLSCPHCSAVFLSPAPGRPGLVGS